MKTVPGSLYTATLLFEYFIEIKMFYCMLDILCCVSVRCTYYEAFVFISKRKMLIAGQKRKHIHKTLREKSQTLKRY